MADDVGAAAEGMGEEPHARPAPIEFPQQPEEPHELSKLEEERAKHKAR